MPNADNKMIRMQSIHQPNIVAIFYHANNILSFYFKTAKIVFFFRVQQLFFSLSLPPLHSNKPIEK